jgi:hypothetical protein
MTFQLMPTNFYLQLHQTAVIVRYPNESMSHCDKVAGTLHPGISKENKKYDNQTSNKRHFGTNINSSVLSFVERWVQNVLEIGKQIIWDTENCH